MKKRTALRNHDLAIAASAIAAMTLCIYLFSKNAWIFLLGGAALTVMISLSVHQRRRYEKILNQVTEYVDQLLSDQTVNIQDPLADNMHSKLNHQLSKLQKMVISYHEKAQRDKQEIRDLIVEIAHQLRMPLSNIDTYLQLLDAEDISDEERKKYHSAIEVSKEKLIFLIESFIKMSRLESNVIQIRKKSLDLNVTIKDEVEHIKSTAEKREIAVCFSPAEITSVPHDKNWIGEAIFNLLDNGVKYAPTGSTVRLSVIQNEMFTEIRIEDEGAPLPVEEEHLIFKRFYRGSNVTEQEGFGLGLYLTREIVLTHDGFVKFRNSQHGHVFSIFLPA